MVAVEVVRLVRFRRQFEGPASGLDVGHSRAAADFGLSQRARWFYFLMGKMREFK